VSRTTVASWEGRGSAPRAALEQLVEPLRTTIEALAVAPAREEGAPADLAEVAKRARAARDALDELLRVIG
jgi:hypothetical protein